MKGLDAGLHFIMKRKLCDGLLCAFVCVAAEGKARP